MKTLSKDARDFVDGVVKYIKTDSKSITVGSQVRSVLAKVTEAENLENKAVIETAVSFNEIETKSIKEVLERLFGHPIEPKIVVSPKLIGGFCITVGDWVYDATLSSQLKQIKNNLFSSL
jgi:F0F1-type ATP synthase delta subunit